MHLRLHWLIACLLICVITCDRPALALPNAPTPTVTLETAAARNEVERDAQRDAIRRGLSAASGKLVPASCLERRLSLLERLDASTVPELEVTSPCVFSWWQ